MLFLAWTIAASAQEPPSLRAAPDAGTLAQENRDIAGRWLGATDAAIQSVGKAGGTLTNIVTGKFEGISKSISIADAASTLGAASALDVRGTVSGAAAIAIGGKVTASGAALFGEIGAVTGGAVGSFFPVIGNIAGTMVGGAVGTAAGGFVAAFGYDKYIKDYVTKGVTGLVSVFDTAPLDQAMQARRAFLLQTMSAEQQAQLQTFKSEEVALLDFGTLPYVPVLKQPPSQAPTPGPQQQAALPPPSSFLAGVRKIELFGRITCDIAGGQVTCRDEQVDEARMIRIFTGTIGGNRIDGTIAWDVTAGFRHPCPTKAKGTQKVTYTLAADGTAKIDGGIIYWTKAEDCSGYRARDTSPASSGVGTWRVLE